MKIIQVYCLPYSATGTTDKMASAVAEAAAKKLGVSVESIGLVKLSCSMGHPNLAASSSASVFTVRSVFPVAL